MNQKIKRIILVILLVIVATIIRTHYKYPPHPDHYALAQYTESIIREGYAPWVLHPMSLLGYYPLSKPSGFEYFSANLILITGLDLPNTFLLFSLFTAFYASFALYTMMRKWTKFEISLLSSFILLTMVTFALDTQNTASSRIFNIMLTPLFINLIFNFHESIVQKKVFRTIKYLITILLIYLVMSIIHRLTQLSIIFIISYLCAVLTISWQKLLIFFQKTKFYDNRKKFYSHSKLYVAIDIFLFMFIFLSVGLIKNKITLIIYLLITTYYYFIINFKLLRSKEHVFIDFLFFLGILIITKAVDLAIRGRLLIKFLKYIPNLTFPTLAMLIILLSFLLFVVYISFHKHFHDVMEKIINYTDIGIHKLYGYVEQKPIEAIYWALFVIFGMLVFLAFAGKGLYTIDRSYYYDSFLLKGQSTMVVWINFLFNINNNLTTLIVFAPIGIIYLFGKTKKNIYSFFFIFVALGFSQLLFDWEYVRLYMNPMYALFTSIGIYYVFQFIYRKLSNKKLLVLMIFISIFTIHFLFSNVFILRDELLSKVGLAEEFHEIPNEQIISAGSFVGKDKSEFSILGSVEGTVVSKLAYYSNKPEAVIAQNIYVVKPTYNITSVTIDELRRKFNTGTKITELFEMEDWIFGGNYFFGRHIMHFKNNNIFDPIPKRIIDSYKIKYILDTDIFEAEKYRFFQEISQNKNLIYSTKNLYLYDLKNGRRKV